MNPIEQISQACVRGIASFDPNTMWWESFWHTTTTCIAIVAVAITLIVVLRTMMKLALNT